MPVYISPLKFQVVCKFIENTSNPQNLARLIYSIFSETNQYTNIKSTNSDQEDEITDKLVLDNNEIIENSEILEFIVNSKISSNLENNIQIQQDEEEPVVKDYFDEKFVWKKQKIISMSREIEPPKRLFLPHRRLSLQHTNKISSALGNSITSYYSSM